MPQRVVAITGGSSGIGLAISELFLANGYNVAIFAQSIERMQAIQRIAPDNTAVPQFRVNRKAWSKIVTM